jgi:CBS domain-containing protein
MASNRGDAALIVDESGGLGGIVTDTDVTRRVVARLLDPASTTISTIMTAKPVCVTMSDSATDALATMVENRFRHLPVVDDKGKVVGLLDIAKCLRDVITRLERAQEKSDSVIDAAQIAASLQGVSGAHAAALHALLGPLMAQAFGNRSIASIRGLLASRPNTIVGPNANLLEVGMLMAESRKAVLIVEEGRLAGIFGFKDMVTRAVAKELPLAETAVSSVMTPNPESISPNITVLEALQTMHDNKFLTLPVCEEDGTVVGLVDVMDVIYGCGGAEGWRSIFSSSIDHDNDSVSSATSRGRVTAPISSWKAESELKIESRGYGSSVVPGSIPTILEIEGDDNEIFPKQDALKDKRDSTVSPLSEGPVEIFKVTDHNGNTHRIRTDVKVSILKHSLATKVGLPKEEFHLLFVDNEGDSVVISNDDDLQEAVNMGKKSGGEVVKLSMSLVKHKIGGVGGILGLFRPKHRRR